MITIARTIEIEVPAKDGKKVVKAFPCQVNAGVPFSHRMNEYE